MQSTDEKVYETVVEENGSTFTFLDALLLEHFLC